MSKLNVLLVYPACSKYTYNASEADCRASARSLFPSARTPLSLSLSLSLSALFSERLKGAALSVKTQICCFSNFTCKYSRNHSTAMVFILCVAYLTISDDGTIINHDFLCRLTSWKVRAGYVVLMGHISVTISYLIPLSDNNKQ